MKIETKKIIFLINIISFLIFVPLLIFYAEGKKIIPYKNKIIETGGIYIQSPQKKLIIYLDNKEIGTIDLLRSSFFYNQLEPKNYFLQVKKNGYLPFSLNIEINKKFVNQYFDLQLIKENPNFLKIKDNIDAVNNIYYNDNKILFKTIENGEYNLYLISNNSFSNIFKTKNDFLVKNVQFNDTQDSIILQYDLEKKESNKYQLMSFQNGSLKEKINFELLLNPDVIFSNPNTSYEIFYLYTKKLIKYNLTSQEKIELANNVISIYFNQNKIFYFTDNGFLFELNIYENSKKVLNSKPFLEKKIKKFSILYLSDTMLLFSKEGIYRLDKGEFIKIFKGAENFSVSPNKKRVIFNIDNELYCLQNVYSDNRKLEFIFLDRFFTLPFNFFWVSNNNLLLTTNNIIKVFYLNQIEKLYFCYSAPTVPGKILFYNQSEKRVYLENNKSILKSDEIF